MAGASIVLKRYFEVCKGKELPFYALLKKVECKKPDSIGAMWREHDKNIRVFRKEKISGFKNIKNKTDAEFSLLDLKYEIAHAILNSCVFCERRCMANRAEGKLGWCRVGKESRVSTMFEHWGEERCLIPSGTIFFSGCNWHCVYCQNWDISQYPERGVVMAGKDIAAWIDDEVKTRNIINANFVGGEPTPNLHTVIDAVRNMKTNMPIVWNSNMYMSEEAMKLLEGVVDVYLADFRYGKDECAMRLSGAPNYIKTMDRNFRRASEDAEMMIRVLVLPSHVECCTKNILEWIGKNIAGRSYVNLMRQYKPEYKAQEYRDINRRLRNEEYQKAIDYLSEFRVKYFEIQG